MKQFNRTVLSLAAFLISVFLSVSAHAWGNVHHHGGGGWGYGPGPGPGYYGPGFYPGWGGPNLIINVPVQPIVPRQPYYVRECETVEICNQYDECWLERQCN